MRTLLAVPGAAGLSLLVAVTASAEPLPMPSIDYSTKATVAGGATMLSRHSKGKLRVEMQVPGMPQPMTSYIDLNAKKGVAVISAPGMPAMAMEIEFGDGEEYGVAVGQGKRIGTAVVAGEPCNLWQIESSQKEMKEAAAVTCVTADSIPLRMEATVDGKREVVLEVTELLRGPQDPKLFTLPSNLKVMRVPKGGMPPMGKQ